MPLPKKSSELIEQRSRRRPASLAQLLEELREHLQAVDALTLAARATFSAWSPWCDTTCHGSATSICDERPLTALARHHEGEDARQVGLERHRQQVEHQRRVLVERLGNAERLVDDRELRAVLRFGLLNPALDFADVAR